MNPIILCSQGFLSNKERRPVIRQNHRPRDACNRRLEDELACELIDTAPDI